MAFSPALYAARVLASRALPVMKRCARTAGATELADFGPVFLPSDSGLLPRGMQAETPQSENVRASRLAVCAFSLSMLDEKALQSLFHTLCTEAGHTLFLDFKSPERNLEWPAALLFTPLRRALSRGELERLGGMEGVLYKEKARFTVLARHTLSAGALAAVLVRNCL